MKTTMLTASIIMLLQIAGCSQSSKNNNSKQMKHIGGGCEGCEAIYESRVPFELMTPVDTLPDFNEKGPKLEISGIVYQRDGKTPAKNVVLYVYHTDQTGHYTPGPNAKGWEKRNGRIRGWIKTDKNGFYRFYTLKPAAYPNTNIPAHIHIVVKEPDKNEYWIDEYLFEGDPFLTDSEKGRQEKRGGNGIISLEDMNGMLHGKRNVFLGVNIPDYPYAGLPKISSGLAIGSSCPAFDPLHLSGADGGKKTCPMCKYGSGQGVMIWFNHANLDHMKDFVTTLESEMVHRGEKKLRVFLIYMNPFHTKNRESEEIAVGKIKKWCNEQGLKHVAMLLVPSPQDPKTCGLYKINEDAKNTVFLYKKRIVTNKWVNIEYDDETLKDILTKLDDL